MGSRGSGLVTKSLSQLGGWKDHFRDDEEEEPKKKKKKSWEAVKQAFVFLQRWARDILRRKPSDYREVD